MARSHVHQAGGQGRNPHLLGEDWADDVAVIEDNQIVRINVILCNADSKLTKEFERFVEGLRNNLNDSISETEAVSMLFQRLITAPVLNAFYDHYDFIEHNPVALGMQRIVTALEKYNLGDETESLEKFYESGCIRASEVTSASGKQQIIKELYERFFRKAFKKQAEALGIVYTPVEIVNFILRAADDALHKHFGKGLTDEGGASLTHLLAPPRSWCTCFNPASSNPKIWPASMQVNSSLLSLFCWGTMSRE